MRRLLVLLGVVLTTAAACAPAPSKQPQEVRMPTDVPFEIRLEATKGPGFSARLVNRSGTIQPVLHDFRLQPSRLILTGADGAEIESTDRRELMKFDPRVYCHLVRSVPPGGELSLDAARFEKDEGSWSLTWGPFGYEEIPPGSYSARLTWSSAVTTCHEDAESDARPVAGIWLGTVESNRVEFTLR